MWTELHSNIRAFVARRVRQPADVDDIVQQIFLRVHQALPHDGRSINLTEVILRHGGEAQGARDAFAAPAPQDHDAVVAFLNSLVIFPPDDTASNLDPGDRTAAGFPQYRHGSIRLTGLFNNPWIGE